MFLKVCDTWKLNGVSTNIIGLQLFPFSMSDNTPAWLHPLPSGSTTTWDELTKALVAKFLTPSKTPNLRNQITIFAQREDGNSMRLGSSVKICCSHALIMDSKVG